MVRWEFGNQYYSILWKVDNLKWLRKETAKDGHFPGRREANAVLKYRAITVMASITYLIRLLLHPERLAY